MTDGPTNRINRPPARRGDRDDARTQLAPPARFIRAADVSESAMTVRTCRPKPAP